MEHCAPVAVFAYNRPEHLRRTLGALASASRARESGVTVYIDGPREPGGSTVSLAVRQVADSFQGQFARLDVVQRDRNLGLAGNIVSGVSEVLRTSSTVIVVEDDIVVAPVFLDYMNASLASLVEDRRVGSIHGYCYPGVAIPGDYFYLKGGDCWGWATWADRWALYEPSGRQLLWRLLVGGSLLEFTMAGAAPYCRMLCRQILGKNNSWAVRWHASLFLAGRLTLYPSRSLVTNIGLDGSGEHCGTTAAYDTQLAEQTAHMPHELPVPLESAEARSQFATILAGGGNAFRMILRRTAGMLLDLMWIARVGLQR